MWLRKRKRRKMEFEKTELIQDMNSINEDYNSYFIVSKPQTVDMSEFEKVIKIVDESGKEINCTLDKFVEIFDKEGLTGFIL